MEKVIYSLLMLCFLQICKGQNIKHSEYFPVISIKKGDKNYKLSKKDDGDYKLLIYHTKNISYNKKHNLKYDTLADGRVLPCNGCRLEKIVYLLHKKHKVPKNKKVKYYTLYQFIYEREKVPKTFEFGGGGFLIDGVYYSSEYWWVY